ncbi:MAG: hypothetical protein P1V97_17385, partial [Planctomycetota bacterium]|nr:hypothetical protein [Planctomycetota bacterium]
IDSRLEWSRRSSGLIPSLTERQLELLLKHFGDNIRAMEYHLYEVFQGLEKNGPVTLDASAFPDMSVFAERAHN